MTKKPTTQTYQLIEASALILSCFYFQSVLTVAHHISGWPKDGIGRIAETPTLSIIIVSLLLIGYTFYKKRKLSSLSVIALTVLVVSSLFWLSALRTNFY